MELSTVTGYNHCTVRMKLKQFGLKFKCKSEKRVPDETLVQLVKEGKNINQIANITGCQWGGVKYRLDKLGLKAKKGEVKKKVVSDEKFIQWTKEGKTRKQIQTISGLAYNTIFQRLKALCLKPVESPKVKTKESIAIDRKIAQLRQYKLTYKEIGKKVGLSEKTVYLRIKKMKERGEL